MEISIVFPVGKDRTEAHNMLGTHPFSTFNSSFARQRQVWAIVAMGRNGEIGFEGYMPWHLPEDLKHFKQITMGHPVIMGRKTWLSIPRRPLPGRRNIILTRNPEFETDGAETAASIAEAVALCPPPEVPVIIGGGSVYTQAMPLVTRIYVTRIDSDFPDADTFFPAIDRKEWNLIETSDSMLSTNGLSYRFEIYERHHN